MSEIVCVDFINKKSIFVCDAGGVYFSNRIYGIGEPENKANLSSIDTLPLEEQLEIKNTL